MKDLNDILKLFSQPLREFLLAAVFSFECLQEIRLRVHCPLILIINQEEWYLRKNGGITKKCENVYLVTNKDLKEVLMRISNYSLYAYEDEIQQGYITIQGGHRVGLSGKVILENHRIKTMQYISFMNIRVAHEIKGCADQVMPFIYDHGKYYHTLIISPPCCGKTTLLRDIIRQISNRSKGISIGVVDERSEIAASYMGIPQNDVGLRTDVLDGCPKHIGMIMLLRAMSPRIIAVDEIGNSKDEEALTYVINCGCKILATVHGNSMEDLQTKKGLNSLMNEHIFERYIVLSNREIIGHVEAVYDAFGNNLLFN